MNARRWVVVVALAALAGGCSSRPPVVTVLHFSGADRPASNDGAPDATTSAIVALRTKLRASAPALLTTFGGNDRSPAAGDDGLAAARRLNSIGVDWATFGAHDFDVPEAAFRKRMAEQKFTVVTSNVTNADGYAFEGTLRSTVISVKTGRRDLRVGLIGLTSGAQPQP